MTSEDTPKGNTAEAIDFLDSMLPGLPRHLVAIYPSAHIQARTFLPGDREEMKKRIEAQQGKSNLYFHVNTLRPGVTDKKATKDDVSAALFLHVDVDDLGAKDRILNFSPRPTAVVFSGGGYQSFWRLKEPSTDLGKVEAANKAIAKRLGGDNCHNIDRIMRLPGTVNIPNAKKLAAGRVPTVARVLDADWSLSYSLDQFPQDDGSEPIGSEVAAKRAAAVVPATIDLIQYKISPFTRTLIEHGDDPERPIDSESRRYRSRSEAVFRVACDLARAGCSEEMIAGVLINPAYGISASILEKKYPKTYAARQARSALATVSNGWPDMTKTGPKSTMRNALVALQRLDLCFSHDLFRHRKVVNGAHIDEHQGEISDDACAVLRARIIEEFNFDPKAENVRDAVTQLCLDHTFHPIRQIYEIGEISGLNKTDVERTKAFASRPVDRARMAYGRFSEARPRQTIFVGTTNEYKYLKDRAGNRRFLPVRTGTIELEALRRDRDQLWAEAAVREAQAEEITLPENLWEAAAVEQEERLEDDPWLDKLASVGGRAFGNQVRAFTTELLEFLGIEVERQHSGHTKRLAALMRSLGWETGKFKMDGKTIRGFHRPKPEGHIDDTTPIGVSKSF